MSFETNSAPCVQRIKVYRQLDQNLMKVNKTTKNGQLVIKS